MRSVSQSLSILFMALLSSCATFGPVAPTTGRPFQVTVVGHGPPMIFIPGLASSGEVWQEVVAHYQDRYECHVLTLAGFAGQSTWRAPLLPAVHDALAQYIREHQFHRPVLVGHSLGGFLALWLASTDPDLVGAAVILDSAPSLSALQDPELSPTEARLNADQFLTMMRTATPDQRARSQRQAVKAMVSAPDQAERVARWGQQSDPETVAEAMHYILTHDLRADLAKVRAPTLVIAAWLTSSSIMGKDELKARFQQQYSNCSTCTVTLDEHARHFVMLDNLNGVLASVDDFLQKRVVVDTLVKAP